MPKNQRGIVLIAVATFVMLAVLTYLVVMTSGIITSKTVRFSLEENQLSRLQKSLVAYTSTYHQLPCPADPTIAVNAGFANGDAANTPPADGFACTYPNGVVPWRSLGLTQADVTDVWGRLISYRVYDNDNLGLTHDEGATAANCDTDNSSTPPVAPLTNGQCDTGSDPANVEHDTLSSDFINYDGLLGGTAFSKGVEVDNFGNNVTNLAFILISHGPSGLGGYLPSGSRMTMPSNTAADYPNTQALAYTSPYQKLAASDAAVVPGEAGHFDDIVLYLSITDLLKLAGLEARDWPEANMPSFNPTTTANMTSPSTNPASPHFMSSGAAGSGQEFTATDAGDGAGTAVTVGAAGGSYSACLWWPLKLVLTSGATRRSLITYMEFASVDNGSDVFPGFTEGFLSGLDSAPTNNTCGTSIANTTTASGASGQKNIDVASVAGIELGMNVFGTGIAINSTVSSISGLTVTLNNNTLSALVASPVSFADGTLIRRDLGWGGGTLAGYTNRFAVEFDAVRNRTAPKSANDPSSSTTLPHLAVDFYGVIHAVSTTGSSSAGSNVIAISNGTGISQYMGLAGTGIASGTTVASFGFPTTIFGISQNTTSAVSGLLTFNVSTTATGSNAQNTITVLSSSNISIGMKAVGTGVAANATVTKVSGTTVTLSSANTSAVSGTVNFATNAESCGSLSIEPGCNAQSPSTFPGVVRTATGSTGATSISITDADGVTGIVNGMSVSGTGIGALAIVKSISGNVVGLSTANSANVTGNITFSTLSSAGFMRNGLDVFHGIRLEIYPKSCVQPIATGGDVGDTRVGVSDASQIKAGMLVYGLGIDTGTSVVGVGPVITTATGAIGVNSITVTSAAGITVGMAVSGTGIASGAIVQSVAGSTVTLSAVNTSAVSGTITFDFGGSTVRLSKPASSLLSGPIIFGGGTATTTTATGSSGGTTISVLSGSGIDVGMAVLGTGISPSAVVTGISGATITLSNANTKNISSGAVRFTPVRTLIKSWALSNSGCAENSTMCTAMKNLTDGLYSAGAVPISTTGSGASGQSTIVVSSASGLAAGMTASGSGIATGALVLNVSGTTITLSAANTSAVSGAIDFNNRQVLHTVSCVPATSAANAYNSLYFGITTANRSLAGTAGANVIFRRLAVNNPSAP